MHSRTCRCESHADLSRDQAPEVLQHQHRPALRHEGGSLWLRLLPQLHAPTLRWDLEQQASGLAESHSLLHHSPRYQHSQQGSRSPVSHILTVRRCYDKRLWNSFHCWNIFQFVSRWFVAGSAGEAGADQVRDSGAGGESVAVHGDEHQLPAQHRGGHGHLPGQDHRRGHVSGVRPLPLWCEAGNILRHERRRRRQWQPLVWSHQQFVQVRPEQFSAQLTQHIKIRDQWEVRLVWPATQTWWSWRGAHGAAAGLPVLQHCRGDVQQEWEVVWWDEEWRRRQQ